MPIKIVEWSRAIAHPARRAGFRRRQRAASPNAKRSASAPGLKQPKRPPISRARARARDPHFHAQARSRPLQRPSFSHSSYVAHTYQNVGRVRARSRDHHFHAQATWHIPTKMWVECPPPPPPGTLHIPTPFSINAVCPSVVCNFDHLEPRGYQQRIACALKHKLAPISPVFALVTLLFNPVLCPRLIFLPVFTNMAQQWRATMSSESCKSNQTSLGEGAVFSLKFLPIQHHLGWPRRTEIMEKKVNSSPAPARPGA